MRLVIRTQSVSDLITNSSSELFVVASQSMPATTLAELLKTIGDKNYFTGDWKEWDNLTEEEKEKYDSSSGMGGKLNIMTFDQMYEKARSYIPCNKRHLFTKEIYSLRFPDSIEELETFLWVDIDHRRCATISWMIDNLDIKECSCPCKVDPETKKVIKLIDWDEWDKLPDNEKNKL